MTDPRPSISELQRIARTTCPRCRGPAGECAGAPRTIEEQAEDNADLRNAAPVLLEIAAAALAWAETNSCDPNDAGDLALLNAITRIRP